MKEVEERFNQDNWELWKIINSSNRNYMGYVGLWCFFDEDQPQLLYALLPEHTGNGYATEASQEVVQYAFKYLNFDYLIATMAKPNTGSVNVCKRLGMDFEEEKEVEGKPTLFFRLENKAG
nr:GNAT family N-acetyltransferase [Fulvivirga sp. M361]